MCLCQQSTLKAGGVREGGCSLESAMQIYGNLASGELLGILKPTDPSILDAASQDFNLSKFCAMWRPRNEKGVPFPYSLTIFII